MNRMNAFAALALTLGAVACDRNTDKASETNTTSATPPQTDPATAPALPLEPSKNDDKPLAAPIAPQERPDAGTKDGGPHAPSGLTTGTQSGTTGNPNSGTTARPNTGGVAPGHIMFPPEKGPGTGEPNSAGSHNLGSGSGAGKK